MVPNLSPLRERSDSSLCRYSPKDLALQIR